MQARRRIALLLAVIVVALLVFGSALLLSENRQQPSGADRISLPNGVALCSHFGIDQVSYLSASVAINGTSMLRSLTAYINGTFESTVNYSFNSTNYITNFSINPANQTMPILPGKTYVVMLVALFQDGSAPSASSSVIAC